MSKPINMRKLHAQLFKKIIGLRDNKNVTHISYEFYNPNMIAIFVHLVNEEHVYMFTISDLDYKKTINKFLQFCKKVLNETN